MRPCPLPQRGRLHPGGVFLANCTGGPTEAAIEGFFDNVFVNQSALP